MINLIEVKVPDIGDFSDVPVIDLFVKVGDPIKVNDAICTLESDKATMDVPEHRRRHRQRSVGPARFKVSEGSLLIKVRALRRCNGGLPGKRPAPVAAQRLPLQLRWPATSAGGADSSL